MYNTKFTLKNGKEIFPNYMDLEQRAQLKKELGDQAGVMWCSCRNDRKLYYKISAHFHFYPEHNGYEHSPLCSRHQDNKTRKTALVRSDNETATVYLKFNPLTFSIPSQKQDLEQEDIISEKETLAIHDFSTESDDENEIVHLKKKKVKSKDDEVENYNLGSFVKCINHDTFSERMINQKPILSKDYFTNALFGRLKNIRINGMEKNVRGLSLEEDGIRFFYAPYVGCNIKKDASYTSYNLVVKGSDNKVYTLFTFESIYERELKRFVKRYGTEPDEHTMIAGFQYLKRSKKNKDYKVVGRFHLFRISDYGIYSESLTDGAIYDSIIHYIRNHPQEKIRFYFTPEEEEINGIIEVEGCVKKGILLLPSVTNPKNVVLDNDLFVPLIPESSDLTTEMIQDYLKQLKEDA